MSKKRIHVVGTFPEPVGGVSSFIYRLANTNMVDHVIDIYPRPNKHVPEQYQGDYTQLPSTLSFVLRYLTGRFGYTNQVFHFNFSTPNALPLILLLPTLGNEFHLTLHHGVLKSKLPRWATKFLGRKLSMIYALSDKQLDFYASSGMSRNNTVKVSSYVKPQLVDSISNTVLSTFAQRTEPYKHVLITSGMPEAYYNNEWAMDALLGRDDVLLIHVLYGEGDESIRDSVQQRGKSQKNVWLIDGLREDEFHYLLSRCDLYIRPTARDSFGIVVADAIHFGIDALASDVCDRFPNTYLYQAHDYEDFQRALFSWLDGRTDLIRKQGEQGFESFNYKFNKIE